MEKEFTILKITLPDGCVAPHVSPIVEQAVKCSKIPTIHRGHKRSLKRFTVYIDGERHGFTQERSLRAFLQSTSIGSRVSVFRNGDYGATIKFLY